MTLNENATSGAPVIDSIVVLGDSNSSGFGTGGRGYPVLVAEALGAAKLENLARFSRTAKQMFEEDLDRIVSLRPELVIVHAGGADSLPHPGERVQRMLERFVPSTWHGVDGLERRAYFSGTRLGRARQRLVAESKTTIKRTLITLTGGFTRSTPEEFRVALDALFTELETTCPFVVSLGLFDVDQHIFPKQHEMSMLFRAQREQVLEKHPRVIRVEIDRQLHRWDDFHDDHGHWNISGHQRVATEILRALRSAVPELAIAPPNVA